MRVIITGHTGLEKKDFLRKVKSLSAGVSLEIYDLETQTEKQCKARSPFHLDQYFPKKDDFIEKRRKALERILERERRKNPINSILNIHATYRRQLIPFHVLDYKLLYEFRPDLFVTLIDDVYRVQARIQRKARRIADISTQQITLKDIMEWRSDEIMLTETMASFVSSFYGRIIPHFIVPLRGGEQVVYQLIFQSKEAVREGTNWKPKAYIGFPITKTYTDNNLRDERDRFRQEIKKLDLIIFDPYAIEERRLVHCLEEAKKQAPPPDVINVTSEDGQEVFEIETKQAEAVIEDIKLQVATRDFRLISQSDFFAGFRPAHSPGERIEIQNANQLGKPVYVIWPDYDPPADDFGKLAISDKCENLKEFFALITDKVIPYFRRQ